MNIQYGSYSLNPHLGNFTLDPLLQRSLHRFHAITRIFNVFSFVPHPSFN